MTAEERDVVRTASSKDDVKDLADKYAEQVGVVGATPALANVEATTKALREVTDDEWKSLKAASNVEWINGKYAAEAYHDDKAAGKETDLTRAVEQLLGKPKEATPQAGVVGGEVKSKNGITSTLITEKENPNLQGKAFIEVKDANGKVIGTIGVFTDTGVFEKDGKKYASISGISTTEEFRGKGFGIELYRQAFEQIKKLGFEGLYSSDAEVVDKKRVGAIRNKLIIENLGNGEYLYLGVKAVEQSPQAEQPLKAAEQQPTAPEIPPITAADFEATDKTNKAGRKARQQIREQYGTDTAAKMEYITKNFEEAITNLEKQGKIRKICP